MLLVVYDSIGGDVPIKVYDEKTDFWFKPDIVNKKIWFFIYHVSVGTKEIVIAFETYDKLKNAMNLLSKQVIEYQNKKLENERYTSLSGRVV